MDKPFCTYRLLSREENSYFIGANSEKGFIMANNDRFNEENFDRVFILKGGPGTGKSTFMRKTANEFKDKDFIIEYYYCSSDPDSLDAVIIKNDLQRYLIIDGTNPHVTEMRFPGAVSEIIDVSSTWSRELLTERKKKIFELTKSKSSCFESAYKYLSAAAELHRSQLKLSYRVCDIDKMNGAVLRMCSSFKKKEGTFESLYTDAFSMDGAVATDCYFRSAETIYYLTEPFGIYEIYLKQICQYLEKHGVGHVKLISPVNSEALNGVYIKGPKCLMVAKKYRGDLPDGKDVNMKRFLNGEERAYKGRYRFGTKCENALYEGAYECLLHAKEHHFELEQIYSEAMNFKKLNRICNGKISPLII